MKKKNILFAAIVGNILEYYDFIIYAMFAIQIGKEFFPSNDPSMQLLLSLLTFGLSFVARPVGGMILGYIGDKYGRKISLLSSITGMSLATFIMGIMPNYENIGILAPIMIGLIRIIQGICIGGEGTAVFVFILEHYQKFRPGLMTGLVYSANGLGVLLATLIAMILPHYFPDIAWRLAFLLGGFMGILGLYLRWTVSETEIFKEMIAKKKNTKNPIIELFKFEKTTMFIIACAAACSSSIIYLIKTYLRIFYNTQMGYNNQISLIYLSVAILTIMIASPIGGHLVDKLGKIQVAVTSAILVTFCTIPCFLLIALPNHLFSIIGVIILSFIAGITASSQYILCFSLLKPQYKASGTAFSYNIGVIPGGLTATISHILIDSTKIIYSPGFYVVSLSAVVLVVFYFLRDDIAKKIAYNDSIQ